MREIKYPGSIDSMWAGGRETIAPQDTQRRGGTAVGRRLGSPRVYDMGIHTGTYNMHIIAYA